MTGLTDARERVQEARRLTQLLNAAQTFSFIRLGDGELYWALAVQENQPAPKYRYLPTRDATVELTGSTSGLEEQYLPRFISALESCSYLDWCQNIPYVQQNLGRLRVSRDADARFATTPETSNILFEWTRLEFAAYVREHRCALVAGEAPLIAQLTARPGFREYAGDFAHALASMHLVVPVDMGRRCSENLSLLLEQIQAEVQRTGCDTVFISLGTAAKILCVEIARNLGIRAIDFGSMPRALTYSACPGYQPIRSLHNPFLFRLPASLYLPAMKRAYRPEGDANLLRRAQAQLSLELQALEVDRFNTVDAAGGAVDHSPAAVCRFTAAMRTYYAQFWWPMLSSWSCARLHLMFLFWRAKRGIDWTYRVLRVALAVKRAFRRLRS